MNFDPALRLSLAESILCALRAADPESTAGMRGSLARSSADAYSDIDLFWEVPDSHLEDAVDRLPEILAEVGPLSSLRSDPLLQNSARRRLIFALYAHVPLFWRVDIEVFAASIGRDDAYDLDNPAARGEDWSLPESALMNAVAALKYLLRDDRERAQQSLERAFDRIGEPVPDADPWDAIDVLTLAVGGHDLDQAELIGRLQRLHRSLRPPADRCD